MHLRRGLNDDSGVWTIGWIFHKLVLEAQEDNMLFENVNEYIIK